MVYRNLSDEVRLLIKRCNLTEWSFAVSLGILSLGCSNPVDSTPYPQYRQRSQIQPMHIEEVASEQEPQRRLYTGEVEFDVTNLGPGVAWIGTGSLFYISSNVELPSATDISFRITCVETGAVFAEQTISCDLNPGMFIVIPAQGQRMVQVGESLRCKLTIRLKATSLTGRVYVHGYTLNHGDEPTRQYPPDTVTELSRF